jgi:hypothetical protein
MTLTTPAPPAPPLPRPGAERAGFRRPRGPSRAGRARAWPSAIGGFTGSDAAPTLAQFQEWVKEGLVRYFIAGNGMGGGQGGGSSSGSGAASEITAWVESHYTSTTVGGVTVYHLTSASS